MKRISLLLAAIVFIGLSGKMSAQDDKTKNTVTSVVGSTEATSNDLKKLKTDSTSNWKLSGAVGINSALTTLYNWAAGGNNSALFVGSGNLRLIYQKDKFAWETFFDTELGYTYIDKATYAWRKSNDKINLSSKAGYDIGNNFYATLLGAFRSQYSAFVHRYFGGYRLETEPHLLRIPFACRRSYYDGSRRSFESQIRCRYQQKCQDGVWCHAQRCGKLQMERP